MNYNDAIKLLIEYLKSKGQITDLEKDILDTANELDKTPFERSSAETKVKTNNIKHPDIFATISCSPDTIVKPFSKVSDDDVKYNLRCQLELLIAKRERKAV